MRLLNIEQGTPQHDSTMQNRLSANVNSARIRSPDVIYYGGITIGIPRNWREGTRILTNPILSIPHIQVLSKRRKGSFQGIAEASTSFHSVE